MQQKLGTMKQQIPEVKQSETHKQVLRESAFIWIMRQGNVI